MSKKTSYRVRTFSTVVEEAKALPPAIRLYGDLIYKNEVTILAGDTGVGKSLLAVDIAISLANGAKKVFPLVNESEPLKVLYLDYELSDRQFGKRFHGDNYPESLHRVDIHPECEDCSISADDIKQMILDYKADVLVIDNLLALIMDSGKDAEIAINIMRQFKTFQKELGITILVLAHTPKRYENTPLKVEDVAGSKIITNFADSVFFIGRSSQGANIRYLKHVKMRNSEDPNGTYTLELKENEHGLYFEYIGMSQEFQHLKEPQEAQNNRDAEIFRLYNDENKTMEEIASIFNLNKSTVSRILKKVA